MIELKPLKPDDREQLIKDNQESFNYGALEELVMRDGMTFFGFKREYS